MSKEKTCGDYGGKNKNGEPCKREAGYGTNNNYGKCYQHLSQKATEDELWACPKKHRDSPELVWLWDIIRDFCKKYGLVEVTYFVNAKYLIDNYRLRDKAYDEMIEHGVTEKDAVHGGMLKKHPASTTYFKAQAEARKNIKELVRGAKKENKEIDEEEMKNDPMYKFFNSFK